MIIAVCGFPRAGKSTLLSLIYQHCRTLHESFFVQRGCPDGEGQWTFESANGKALRHKGQFDERFVNWVKNSAKNLAQVFEIVFLDLGGKISEENRQILSVCDAAIIVAKSNDDAAAWKGFIEQCGVNSQKILVVFSEFDEDAGVMRYSMTPEEIMRKIRKWRDE